MDDRLKQDAWLQNGTIRGFQMGEDRTFDSPLEQAA
jgi:hypothetical protein